jgi:hypothetical protein
MELMDNRHKLIEVYRDLSQAEIQTMNDCKAMAENVGNVISELEKIESIDKRWLAIAKTDLQKGFMSLIRSIAQPTTF